MLLQLLQLDVYTINCTEQIKVHLPGGDLMLIGLKSDGPITLTGPAIFVYEERI